MIPKFQAKRWGRHANRLREGVFENLSTPQARGPWSAAMGVMAGSVGGLAAATWVALHAAWLPGVHPYLWLTTAASIAGPLFVGSSYVGGKRLNEALAQWVPRHPAPRRRPLIPNAFFKKALRPLIENVPPRVLAEHRELLATLTPEEHAKVNRATRRAVTLLERHWLRRGVRLEVTHAPWLGRSASDDPKVPARTVRTPDGRSYVLLSRDEVATSSEDALVFGLLHELHHVELERVVFEEAERGGCRAKFGVWAFSVEQGEVVDTPFSRKSRRFKEAQTEFRTALLTRKFVDGGYTDDALAFLSFYKTLPRERRDDFVRSLEAASLVNSFRPIIEFFVAAGVPSQMPPQQVRLISNILNLRFDELLEAMPH